MRCSENYNPTFMSERSSAHFILNNLRFKFKKGKGCVRNISFKWLYIALWKVLLNIIDNLDFIRQEILMYLSKYFRYYTLCDYV